MRGSEARGVDTDVAESIFDLMEKFAGYGFNKSHSAAYALVSYQTAWLKTHYPAYFMAAVLTADMQNTDKIVTLIDECREMNLNIVPPDVNLGQLNFTVNDAGEIVYGLGAIKGLGEGPVENILKARQASPFNDLLDLCQRIDSQAVNRRTMEALIRSGALDKLVEGGIDHSRAMLTAMLPDAVQAAEQNNRNQAAGVDDLFGDITPTEPVNGGRLPSGMKLRPWAEQQRLIAEKETLGLYLSGHLIHEYLDELKHITNGRLANLRPERGTQRVAGLLYDFRTMKNKAGDSMAFLMLDDSSGRFEVSLFAKEYEKYRDLIQKDQILLVECTVSVDDHSGGMKGRAKQIMTLAAARKRFAQRLALNLNQAALPADFCEHLANILAPYRSIEDAAESVHLNATVTHGEANNGGKPPAEIQGCRVVINYERSGSRGRIILGQDWLVSPADDLIQRLRMEYGKDKVALDYRGK
jgi:DNA polymerase-3 subunit alpha